MDAKMGFRNNHYTAYPVRAETIKGFINHGSSDCLCGIVKAFPDII